MELLTDIIVQNIRRSRISEVDFEDLEFGKYVSDHMLIADYRGEWQPPRVVPFASLSLSPASLALHYGQTVFEGMKAFRMKDGRINIFRIERHYERFARSLDRMCMAVPSRSLFINGLMKLVETDREWVPAKEGAALYLRPFIYASEARFGLKISEEYRFVIFTGPVPELYTSPIRVKVETNYIRAAQGGTGFAKCGGNYGGALYPTKLAREQGYTQVLWTDAKEHRFIEESGMMNVMFVIDNVLVTPPLSDSILDGITRDSVLKIAADLGYKIEERPVSIEELEMAFRNNSITEAFGAGTAAVVAPIATIQIKGNDFNLPEYHKKNLHEQIRQSLFEIRTGVVPDIYGWNCIV
jgi:branched-chain amino acid aminotransferase